MKKIKIGIVLILLLVYVTGCGLNKEQYSATIEDNNGDIQTLTSKDLAKLYETNEAKFKKNYTGASIIINGTFESLTEETTTARIGKKETQYIVEIYEITLKENWIVQINKEGNEDFVSSLDEGDKIQVQSTIAMGWNEPETRIYSVSKDSQGEIRYDSLERPEYEYEHNGTVIKKIN